jgi:phenylacetate-CoA ligase
MSDPLWQSLKSAAPEISWPPLMRGAAAALESLARQLDASQWLGADEIRARQDEQLGRVAEYLAAHSGFFRKRLHDAKLSPRDLPGNFSRLPLLSRRDLQRADVHCDRAPDDHKPVREARTSGSTGEPVAVRRTSVSQLFWLAITLREYFWHERDFRLDYSAIRPTIAEYSLQPDWGAPASVLFETGRSQLIPITADIARIADWLGGFAPDVLVIYPNVVGALIEHLRQSGKELPGVKLIRSISETLSPERRAEAARFFDARVVDNYSSQEAGVIAVQCPEGDGYHVMSESLIVEVIHENGAACADGETGRVVLTDLHNFATPLVRYDIGDYAQMGGACSCGRGLPTLKRILGRERNLILMPDGSRHWPLVGFARFRDVAPVVQYQLIQTGREAIEVRLVVEKPLTPSQQGDLENVIRDALGFPFALSFVVFDGKIPAGPRGKFEEFVCRVS